MKAITVSMTLRIISRSLFDRALAELREAGAIAFDEADYNNTDAENLDIVVCSRDILAHDRGVDQISWHDLGLQRIWS
jgi:hypothetical protein